MGGPGFYQDAAFFQAGVNFIFDQVTFGSSGAVASSAKDLGVSSFVHGATGVYVLTLSEQWSGFLNFTGNIKQASYAKTGACEIRLTAFDMSAKTITFLVVDGDGDAVEPTTGDILYLTLQMQQQPNY